MIGNSHGYTAAYLAFCGRMITIISARLVCYMMVATLTIFVAGMLIDVARRFCIEKYILRIGMIKKLGGKLNGVFTSLQNPKH